MAPNVGPDVPNPTHHARLVGGGKDIGLILVDDAGKRNPYAMGRSRLQTAALKTAQGATKYSDFQPPFAPMPQETWAGGRAQETYEDDVTRYLDSKSLQTLFSDKTFLAGQPQFSKGYRDMNYYVPGDVTFQPLLPSGDRHYLEVAFTPDSTYTADELAMLLRAVGTPADLTIDLMSDSAGDPNAVLKTVTISTSDVDDDVLSRWVFKTISSGQSVSSGTVYHLRVTPDSGDGDTDHWEIAVDASAGAGNTQESSDNSTWTTSGVDLYFQIRDADDPADRVFMFRYKGAIYCLLDYDDANPVLYCMGYRGAADSNTGVLSRLVDGAASWDVDEHVGKVAYIDDGPGSLEAQPWRIITGNDASYLEVSPDWKVEHTNSTEYVILGGDEWIEVTGVLGTDHIYDVEVVDGIVYLARGDAALIRSFKLYDNAGTWDSDTDEDAAAYADLLKVVHHNDTTIGKRQMWRAVRSDGEVSRADLPGWGGDFSFGTGIVVGDLYDRMVNLDEYVDPALGDKIPWVFKKGSVWAVKDDIPDLIPLKEMAAVASDNNASATLVHNLFLYWTMFHGGLERFYQDLVTDMGPNRDRGLPELRQGPITDLIGYPGVFFASVNGEGSGYSSILGNNGGDNWHEQYRSDELGKEIKAIFIEVVPGRTHPDRLWFYEGHMLKYLPLPSETILPIEDGNYPFNHEGYIVSSRMYAGLQDTQKLFDSIKLMADNLSSDEVWIEVDYKVDDEANDWTPLPTAFTVSPSEEVNFVTKGQDAVTGKWVQIRMRFYTTDASVSPELRTSLVNTVSRVKTQYGYVMQALIETHPKDLHNRPEDVYYEDGLLKIEDLDWLADQVAVMELSHVLSVFDGLRVFIDGAELSPIWWSDGENLEGYVATIPISQVYRGETVE